MGTARRSRVKRLVRIGLGGWPCGRIDRVRELRDPVGMAELRVGLECPICRSFMRVPRSGGRQVALTCNNGHRFLHTFERSSRWLTTTQFVALIALLLALFAIVFIYRWSARRPGSGNAVTGSQALPH